MLGWVLLLAIRLTASQITEIQREVHWPHELSDLPPDPKAVWGHLENGFRYVILPNDEPPDEVVMRLFVGAGSLMEEENEQGIAHFIEHMAFRGTKHYPRDSLIRYFQKTGMEFGPHINAHTGLDQTVYDLQIPATSKETIADSLQVLRDYADGITFNKKDINIERGVVINENRTRKTPAYRAQQSLWGFVFDGLRLPNRLPGGEDDVLKKLKRKDFLKFYKKWYVPSRMGLIVVGSVDNVPQLEEMIQEYFGSLKKPEGAGEALSVGTLNRPGVVTKLHYEPEAEAVEVGIFSSSHFDLPLDTRVRREIDLRRSIAYLILNRRLEILAQEEGAPFVQGAAFTYDLYNLVQLSAIQVTTDAYAWEDALNVVEQELRRALEHGFTQSEYKEATAQIRNAFEKALERRPTQLSRVLAESMLKTFDKQDVFTAEELDLQLANKIIDTSTPKSVHEALIEAWDQPGRYVFISGDLNLPEPDEQIIMAYDESRKVKVYPEQEEEDVVFAYDNFGPAGKVVEKKEVEDLQITQMRFENNVRVNLKKTDFENNNIRMIVRFGGGELEASPEHPGLAVLAQEVMIGGGLEKHSYNEIRSYLAGKNVSMVFDVDNDAFTFSGMTDREDLPVLMRLITAYIMEPGYRAESLRLARKELEQTYRSLKYSPGGVWANEGKRFLASGDFRFGYPPESEMMKYTLGDVEAWLEMPLDRAYMEVSVVGDFDEDATVKTLSETFGTLPERNFKKEPYTKEREVRYPRGVHKKVITFDSELPRSYVFAVWPTDDFFDIKRTRRLNVLSAIMQDRMRVKIRYEQGQVYMQVAANRSSDVYTDYGYLFGLAEVNPEYGDKVSKMIFDIGVSLSRKGSNKDEFERAVTPLQTQVEQLTRKNEYWLSTVLASSQEQPERLDWARTLITDYHEIELSEINELAKEYLAKRDGMRLLIIPDKKKKK